jgi:AcrR family transcriptional regulator
MKPDTPPVRGKGQRGPKPLLGDEPRDRIYEAALRCFDRTGIRKATMDGVAREAGVSRPTVYYYFSTKEDLLQEVVARQAAKMLADIRHKLTRVQGVDRIVEAVRLGVSASLSNQYTRLLVDGETAGLTGRVMESARLRAIERDFWTPLLTEALSDGALRRDRELDGLIEFLVFTQFSLVAHHEAFDLSEQKIREWLAAYLTSALRGYPEP